MPLPPDIEKLFILAHRDEAELRDPAVDSLKEIVAGLAGKQDQYEDLLNTFFLMANAADRDALITLIIRAASRITNAEAATFFAYLPTTHTLRFSSLTGGAADKLHNAEIPASAGIVGKVVTTKESLTVNDVTRDPLFNPETDKKTGFKTRSILAVPVLARDGALLGVIEAVNSRAPVGFTDGDLTLLALLAQNVAITHRLFNLQ